MAFMRFHAAVAADGCCEWWRGENEDEYEYEYEYENDRWRRA